MNLKNVSELKGLRVFVYFNLHRKCWSVKALEGPDKGRVVAHANHVTLQDARGRVGEAGRQRVLREGRKNVHAGIVGRLAWPVKAAFDSIPLSYNPFKGPTFYNRETGEAWTDTAPAVTMHAEPGKPPVVKAWGWAAWR